jgi:hypothetical protein
MRNKILAACVIALALSCTRARADFVITYTYSGTATVDSTTYTAAGMFQVNSGDIMDGSISLTDIHNVSFTFTRPTPGSGTPTITLMHHSVSDLSDKIPVDSAGALTSSSESKLTFANDPPGGSYTDSVFIGGPSGATFKADSLFFLEELTPIEYEGTWTVATAAAVPEPASLTLAIIGLGGLAAPAYLRKRRAARSA